VRPKQTATVQPAITENVRQGQDEAKPMQLPLLTDVPVFFPRAGGYCLTFPVKPDDECLLVFSDMCIDGWWQSGGVQDQVETRRHDLSDAQALLGITSVPKAVKNYSIKSVMLRNEDKDSYFEIVDDDKTINIVGAEKFNVTTKDDINETTQKNWNVNVKEKANHTSADTSLDSKAPMGIKGSGTELGGGNLRPYWQKEKSAWSVMFLPPVPMAIAPPSPALICMGIHKVKMGMMAATDAAEATNKKVLK